MGGLRLSPLKEENLKTKYMDFQRNLSKNLIVHYSETLFTDDDGTLRKVRFNCSFYGEYMVADVSKKNVERDLGSITGEGSSELWDSFEDVMENKYWDDLKEMFLLHEKEHNSEMG
jgi:hypothetical protein